MKEVSWFHRMDFRVSILLAQDEALHLQNNKIDICVT